MMSSRMMTTNGMAPSTEANFSFIPAQPYIDGFDAAAVAAMAMPGVVDRPPPLLHHHHHSNNLYDTFDLTTTTGCFPLQDPAGLLPPASQLPPPSMAMAMAPPLHHHQLPVLTTTTFSGVSSTTAGEVMYPFVDAGGGGGTIGLNLGRRTYFSPADVLAVDRLLTRSRLTGGGGVGMGLGMGLLGLGLGPGQHHHHHQPPRCQAEGCKADLTAAKHYHRRHKVCEFHAKAAAVAAGGKQQRFCQQCSRFHVLAEFDEAKRSCRKRLTEHNRRRRKPAGAQGKDSPPPPPPKRADTCITASCNSDHQKSKKSLKTKAIVSAGASATAAAKSTAISTNASVVSCLDAMENAQTSSAAAAPTSLSLAAPPLHVDEKDVDGGGLDSMLIMRQVTRGRRRYDDEDDEHRRFMTSLVTMQQQDHQHDDGGHGGHGGGSNMLSCSPVSSDQQQNGGCNGFFEVDFI
ncbi:hypothetical protein HU200_000262 [Digitaria exilis]|uniref:SBP-type domain-containing protein n=1 Tax=Digitaria exilis TaxID=1010633 RepID=A0A835G0S8_9POAL|nr:hypothetical protein HU200_000262 [Digitaria exilis]